jgi:hypothetical protein
MSSGPVYGVPPLVLLRPGTSDRDIAAWLAEQRRVALARGPALRAAALRVPLAPRSRPDDTTFFEPYGLTFRG